MSEGRSIRPMSQLMVTSFRQPVWTVAEEVTTVRSTAKIAFLLLIAAGAAYRSAPLLRSHKARSLGDPLPSATSEWDVRQTGTGLLFRDVQFLDQNVGWGTTNEGFWRTTDGGAHWSQIRETQSVKLPVVNFSTAEVMDGVQFLSAEEGWVLEGSHLIHTIDGGDNWSIQKIEHLE